MAFGLKKRGPTNFERAADGSMTLVEHIRELRTRLFRASLGIVVGFAVGMILATPVFELLKAPYCDLGTTVNSDGECLMTQLGPADGFLLRLKLALWIGLIVAAPVWLYQLWAFIAPGLHRHERKYAYIFVGIAAPLFAAGSALAYFVVSKGLHFLLESGVTGLTTQLEVTRYISFVTNLILIFGVAFEFPLLILMLNFVGIASAKRLLSWWRIAIFVFFAFSAIVTPTPDPFGMTALAVCLTGMYFIAVGVAFLNDRRRAKRDNEYEGLSDDEASPLAAFDPVDEPEPLEPVAPIPAPEAIEYRRYDEST
ncbi:twin-arginine translocase subunit TatC [Phytohabitans aurantiacus]|uniref:Sec-independent protein translocase protein TatC n=1 Tax=Phytohabitans aurantiacus TaxID=3016789 RepID=A0ABQ5R5I6_9ACTN|nr:twin-arginine translocase subunit TatC [Phytohabitans aurantiacus]GLI02049.1 Sec-independent protein translocase protein TatC [Phytohabitans aurantiacus]